MTVRPAPMEWRAAFLLLSSAIYPIPAGEVEIWFWQTPSCLPISARSFCLFLPLLSSSFLPHARRSPPHFCLLNIREERWVPLAVSPPPPPPPRPPPLIFIWMKYFWTLLLCEPKAQEGNCPQPLPVLLLSVSYRCCQSSFPCHMNSANEMLHGFFLFTFRYLGL